MTSRNEYGTILIESEVNMAITDEYGNKLPQPRIKKKAASQMKRERRMLQNKPAFCDMCGYKVRSLNHESGKHHQTAPKVIEAKRKAAMA